MRMFYGAKRFVVLAGVIAAAACGDSGSPSVAVPLHRHVFVVVEENTNYASVVGTGAMPYLDTLIGRSGLATQYYGNTHPSIGNYLMMTVGQVVSPTTPGAAAAAAEMSEFFMP